jgi:hypothetical protein
METDFIDYPHYLMMGEWEQCRVIQLFAQPDNIKLHELIESSRKVGKLEYSNREGGYQSGKPFKYFYEPVIIIEWALAIGLTLPVELVDWYNRQVISIVSPKSSSENLSETERNKYKKQVALLALAVAEKSNIYKIGDSPNVNQINVLAQTILESHSDANTKGLGSSSIRESISEGLKLLNK